MNKPTSLLLVDDHALIRKMIAERLAREPDLQVVGTVEDAVADAVKQKA